MNEPHTSEPRKKSILDRFTLQAFEELIETFHRPLPHLPFRARRGLVRIMPYVALGGAIVYVVSGIVPNIIPPFFVTVKQDFILNGLLLRLAAMLTGVILVYASNPLKSRKRKGWDSLWFISIFQVFFGLLTLHMSGILIVVAMWYVLFEVKSEYS